MLDGPLSQEPWLRKLKTLANGKTTIWDQPRKIYYVQNPVTKDYEVGGYYRSDDNLKFTLLTVPKSGHFVPNTQFLATKTFLSDIIAGGKLVCHKTTPQECETGPIMCNFMNSCSNQGTCSPTTGKCTCNANFVGADCSHALNQLSIDSPSQKTYNTQGI